MSKIIILNGTSSSGKTTLSKALQNKLPDSWLHFQMDVFWDMVPNGVEAHSKNFPRMKEAIAHSAKALLDTDHNIIMDIVCASYDAVPFEKIIEQMRPHQTITALVTAPIEIIEQREKERGDREIGLARSQYESIHSYDYDLILNTHEKTTNQLIKTVIDCI